MPNNRTPPLKDQGVTFSPEKGESTALEESIPQVVVQYNV